MFKGFWGTQPCIPGYSATFVRIFHFSKGDPVRRGRRTLRRTLWEIFKSGSAPSHDVFISTTYTLDAICQVLDAACGAQRTYNFVHLPKRGHKLEHVGYIPAIWSLTVIYFDFRCVLRDVRLAVPIPPELPLQFSPTLTMSCWASAKGSGSLQIFFCCLSFASHSLCLFLIMWFYICLSLVLPVEMRFPFSLQ